jgi:hypothetical protein
LAYIARLTQYERVIRSTVGAFMDKRRSGSCNGVAEGVPRAGILADVGIERRQEARERRSFPLATSNASFPL